MTVFEFNKKSFSNQDKIYKLAIDPGVRTNGFALWEQGSSSISLISKEAPKEVKPTKMYFPVLLNYIKHSQKELLFDIVPSDGEVHCIMEFCHIGGQFSTGLSMAITSYLHTLYQYKNISRVTLVQNRIPEFFLKRRKLTNTEVGMYARQIFGDVLPSKRVPIHAYDAVLFMLFSEYTNMKHLLKEEVRTPNPEKQTFIW